MCRRTDGYISLEPFCFASLTGSCSLVSWFEFKSPELRVRCRLLYRYNIDNSSSRELIALYQVGSPLCIIYKLLGLGLSRFELTSLQLRVRTEYCYISTILVILQYTRFAFLLLSPPPPPPPDIPELRNNSQN